MFGISWEICGRRSLMIAWAEVRPKRKAPIIKYPTAIVISNIYTILCSPLFIWPRDSTWKRHIPREENQMVIVISDIFGKISQCIKWYYGLNGIALSTKIGQKIWRLIFTVVPYIHANIHLMYTYLKNQIQLNYNFLKFHNSNQLLHSKIETDCPLN